MEARTFTEIHTSNNQNTQNTLNNPGVDRSQIIPFEDRPITTMVAICTLGSNIYIPEAFTLLPITQIKIPETKNNTKNIVLPHHPVPGSILSMRFEKEIRGLVLKAITDKHFRNSITIDMSISEKNVNFRLSSSTIHICGVKSFEQIKETVKIVFDHLRSIQAELNYVSLNPEKANKCYKYIQMNIRKHDNKFSVPSDPDIDQRILSFFCRNLSDHNLSKDFLLELEWIMKRQYIYTGELTLSKIETSMINKNYDVGFEVNRQELARHIRGVGKFYHDYDNAIHHSVKIMLPFEIPEGANIRRKKKKNDIPHHTFMVYRSGCVTQSSPSLGLMSQAYYEFFEAVIKLKSYIERKTLISPPIKNRLRINIVKEPNVIEEEDKSSSKDESPKEPRIEDLSEST